MKKVFVRIEMDLPFIPGIDRFTLAETRKIHQRIQDAQGCITEIVFRVTQEQWIQMDFPGMVPASQYGSHIPKFLREIGSCENFRFIAVSGDGERAPLEWWERAARGLGW